MLILKYSLRLKCSSYLRPRHCGS